jgi:hypothetical protein
MIRFTFSHLFRASLSVVMLLTAPRLGHTQAPAAPGASPLIIPDWAWPGSPTHKQVPPPADFHRPSRNFNSPIGIFEGQSDIGSALVPASASYDASFKEYTINSAGYNIWYTRDEFRYLWKKMSGDVSFAGDITFPDPESFHDRKVVLVFRQTLDDDSKQIMVAEHTGKMIHLAQRPDKGLMMKDMQFRFGGTMADVRTKRIGIEKHGDEFALYASLTGEPMHQFGPPMTLHFDGPFYVGLGYCSHFPDKVDSVVVGNVVLVNAAGKVK